MVFFELGKEDISTLTDGDLRELVGRLCEAELIQQGIQPSSVTWGGAQEVYCFSRNWTPKTNQEKLGWYEGFINILKPNLASNDESSRNRARGLLARHFRELWTFAGCFDILEEIVTTHASGGSCPEMWMSIKSG
ncbi:MAG: hypothetical protein GY820_42945 [Gammaproteobacteria bacterium]|nr:hypothetical protein [Gammaproteobacteria bacterium]